VRPGDTLDGIAFRYGLDARSLAAINSLPTGSNIFVGQQLSLPLGWKIKNAPTPALRKRIEVDVSAQHVYAYEGDHLVFSFVGSTGLPTHATRRGRFTVQTKMPMAVSRSLNLDMPYWLGIYYAGGSENGFHGLPVNRTTKVRLWGGLIGRPVSYGCIVLLDDQMKLLYDWAELGTVVDIRN
jgi:lipoprotein-anchoring transpeptidase ErfK/SrfK